MKYDMATETSSSDKGISAFKRAQVRHRRQGAAPNRSDDLDDCLDFSNPASSDCIFRVECPNNCNQDGCYQGPLYVLTNFPGFLYAPQSVSPSLQNELAYRSVSEYCEAPHATNIDLLLPPKTAVEENSSTQSMWELWKQQKGYTVSSSDNGDKQNCRPMQKYRTFSKLSWSTMGYHYDWTARAYHQGRKSPVPPVLEQLASIFARTSLAADAASRNTSSSTKFTASACIVNYYHTKSIMGGHRDDLELALDKPVISFSMGLPAVFLLGGTKKDDVPVLPILIRPGDVMMLGGDCRLCYHGMARVLPAPVSLPPTLKETPKTFQISRESITRRSDGPPNEPLSNVPDETVVPESDREALAEYLKTHRININIRQVLPDDMDVLPALTELAQNLGGTE
jgi:alkylated DNA repair protein alkB family protein 1